MYPYGKKIPSNINFIIFEVKDWKTNVPGVNHKTREQPFTTRQQLSTCSYSLYTHWS